MKKIFTAVFILALFSTLARAAGIQVSPSKLNFKVKVNESAFGELVVFNPASDVQIFEIYPDEFSEVVKANPSSFILEAGERKTVAIKIHPNIAESASQILSTNLSVVGKPLAETQLQTNTGVKIPLSIAVENVTAAEFKSEASPGQFYAALVVVSLGFGAITHLLRRRNKNKR